MPQASEQLRSKFPGGDSQALDVIDANFAVSRGGIIRPKVAGYAPNKRENEAISYLFHEWDYGYEARYLTETAK